VEIKRAQNRHSQLQANCKRLTQKLFQVTIHQDSPAKGLFATMRTLHLKIISCITVVILQTTLFAAEQPAAMLYTHGTALLNGSTIATSSAIFSGDLVETNASSAANINSLGSIVLVLNDSLVRYQGQAVNLEHGGVSISTSKLLATRAGTVVVSPVAGVWTEFEVRDVDGRVEIAARKGDLTITDDKGTTTLAQGQQTTREKTEQEQDNKKKKKRAAAPAAVGGALSSPVAIGIGGAAIVGVTAWVLVKSDDPASPSR
jgi:hypothetical protein